MSFQWLEMRISEEKDRQAREALVIERLPRALAELHRSLAECIEAYTAAFGSEAAEILPQTDGLSITVRQKAGAEWRDQAQIRVRTTEALPGFEIDRAGKPLRIEVGMLPGDKVFYRDQGADEYVTTEELTRRILDRPLFPNLSE